MDNPFKQFKNELNEGELEAAQSIAKAFQNLAESLQKWNDDFKCHQAVREAQNIINSGNA